MIAAASSNGKAAIAEDMRVEHSADLVFQATRARELALSRLLVAFVSTGLLFMLFPGTFLGVWNLLQISGRESLTTISAAWLQAHGHAQVFGWVGSFILGIGFYSLPKLRGPAYALFRAAWVCWILWTAGAALRWLANIYSWHWRLLLPASAAMELAAFLIFIRAVSRHRPDSSSDGRMPPWVFVVAGASMGLFLLLLANFAGCCYLAARGESPAFPPGLDQGYLALMAWGFLAPFVWGFSAKWMSVFLGLKPFYPRLLFAAVLANATGILLVFCGGVSIAVWMFLLGAALAAIALRMFEPAVRTAKTRGVHGSFPYFVRAAYGWLLVAALLGVAAARWDTSGGIWGASRHALTVGFVAVMILSVGQRILPAFAGMRLLWSMRLMFAALFLVMCGCTLRVSCEIIAYQGNAQWAWRVLPASALCELAGLTLFAVNIFGTFLFEPSHAHKEPMLVEQSVRLS